MNYHFGDPDAIIGDGNDDDDDDFGDVLCKYKSTEIFSEVQLSCGIAVYVTK